MTQQFDIIINGGGMAGATLAWGINYILGAKHALKIAIIEASEHQDKHEGFDARVIALSYGSKQILSQLGLWQGYRPLVTPISKISVTDRHHFGRTILTPQEYQVPDLGYVVELADSGQLLIDKLAQAPCGDNITWFQPNGIASLTQHQDRVAVQLNTGDKLSAKLLVAADGGFSKVRALLNMDKTLTQFNQSAIIANVQSSHPHQGVAYECFTEQGPLAFLPMSQGRSSVVWSMGSDEVAQNMDCGDHEFLARLQQAFGFRLGSFIKTGKRVSYPLMQNVAQRHTHHRVALIGNAAQALHPIAGQGFNLGLRDVAALIAQLSQAVINQRDIGEYGVLNAYEKLRINDQKHTVNATSSLVSLFSNNHWPLVMGRNISLNLLDRFDCLKRPVAHQMLGWQHNLPTLKPIDWQTLTTQHR